MSPDDVRRISAWLAATDIGQLELRGPGTALRLRHEGAEVTVAEIEPEGEVLPDLVVNASSVGLFLHRHPLRSEDLAPPGTAVVPGQVLALLQTGPLLLPVLAPAAGVVHALLEPHGGAVGWGTPLVALDPS